MSKQVEYRVREIKRYIVTRFEGEDDGRGRASGSSTQHGQFEDGATAYHVAYALCRAEHDASGQPVESMGFVYPEIPDGVSVPPTGA